MLGNLQRFRETRKLVDPLRGREVFFEVNSVPRVVEVLDRSEEQKGGSGRKAARERADTSNLGSVAAPMAGEVVDVKAKPGAARALPCRRCIAHPKTRSLVA